MKKSYYLIVLVLILGLVLTGCSLLSNIGQVPATGQSGIAYLTKGPLSINLVDLVGLWHFDTDANDSTANNNDGTLMGDAHFTTGCFGNAVSFDGSGDYVEVPDSTSLDFSGEITVEAWIKVAVQKSFNAIVIKGEDGAENYELLLTSSGLLYSTIKFTDGTRYYPSVPSAITDTEWHHVAMTYKPGEWRIYVDGEKKAERMDISKTPLTNDVPLFIGAEQHGGSLMSGRFFNGLIDEVRIWDKALTAKQIEDSFNHGIVIQKGVSKDDVFLGDTVTITLEVVTAHESVTITDTLPDELHYIPGTFKVDGNPAIPEVDEQTISYTLNEPCAYTITFDAQVTSVEAKLYTVTNYATAGGVLASAELTINPYAGFTKVADGDMTVEVGAEIEWKVTITVTNITGDEIALMSNIVVQDRFGGELEIDEELSIVSDGSWEVKTFGKTKKPKIKWDGFSLLDGTLATADLIVFTDINPGGHQSYSTAGEYEMNSGAVLKFIDFEGTGFQLSAHTPQIIVEVKDPD